MWSLIVCFFIFNLIVNGIVVKISTRWLKNWEELSKAVIKKMFKDGIISAEEYKQQTTTGGNA